MAESASEPMPDPVIRITEEARKVVLEARSGENSPENLALFVEINGVANGAYTYDMWFESDADAAPDDAVQHHDDLSVVIVADSVGKIKGATLDVSESGLVILNPNTPMVQREAATDRAIPEGDLSSPLALAVLGVLDNEVNPQIAMHGGRADLVAVDQGVAYLRLSGGCQGCGLAQVTLSQGISVAIKDAVPEISEVVDVTSHGEGSNPYFEAAKK